jgi:hypothetical protein
VPVVAKLFPARRWNSDLGIVEAHHLAFEELQLDDLRALGRKGRYQKIAARIAQHPGRGHARGHEREVEFDPGPRGAAHYAGKQQVSCQIIRSHRKPKRLCRRVEGALVGETFHPVQDFHHWVLQAACALGGDDAASGANKQRVAENHPQLVQRVADGGLGQVEPFGRAGHVSFLQDNQKDVQKVPVEISMIEFVHDTHRYQSIDRLYSPLYDRETRRMPGCKGRKQWICARFLRVQ